MKEEGAKKRGGEEKERGRRVRGEGGREGKGEGRRKEKTKREKKNGRSEGDQG